MCKIYILLCSGADVTSASTLSRHALSCPLRYNGRGLIIRVEVSACPENSRWKVSRISHRGVRVHICVYICARCNIHKRKSDRSLFIVRPRRTSPSFLRIDCAVVMQSHSAILTRIVHDEINFIHEIRDFISRSDRDPELLQHLSYFMLNYL